MKRKRHTTQGPISLKMLAKHLNLDPATVSVVLNEVPGRSIPQVTRDRIKAAAKELNYQPSLVARSLRMRRTHTIGILVPELGDGYHTQVMSSIGNELMDAGFFYFTAHHRHRKNLIEEYGRMLIARGAEALIAIDTALEHSFPVPVVAVAGHHDVPDVTSIVLDHRLAAELTLTHLYSQGHRRIAFMRGQPFSSDSGDRWKGIEDVCGEIGITINPALVMQLTRNISSPELGYPVINKLLASGEPFTALVSFNDVSAIGAMRALEDMGLRVPTDVSVIGFDDIKLASFCHPRLTTIRQPLSDIGRIAAQCALNRIRGTEKFHQKILIEPELVVRESTHVVLASPRRSS